MIWSPRYIDAPILRDTYHTVEGQRVINLDDRLFYLGDANYNVMGLVKYNAGTEVWEVVERYNYTPYGVVTVRDAAWVALVNNVSQFANTTLFTGREYSFNTLLTYYRGRYTDPLLERFINRDPIQADINLYRYCGNNPLTRTDPFGLVSTAPPAPLPLTWTLTVPQIQEKITEFLADFHKKHPKPFGCGAGEFEEAGKETTTYEFLTLDTQHWNGDVGKTVNNEIYAWLVHNVTQVQQEYAVTGTLARREIFKVTEHPFRCCWYEQVNAYQILCPELFSTKHCGDWESRYTIVDEGPENCLDQFEFHCGRRDTGLYRL